ncbi:hypothetical protein PILCRDRAFT_824783 [Piloderma croceum F 1598]|uniref:Uncharacterized protein n=1 Tax=Piloderma croceum (strain F 1598) TaxID=765440 RepID=A0A0C3EZW4_PILCF|nr:hypothetical protein PILCRDRAFT_824783 [Piloderma croceum F 1598]
MDDLVLALNKVETESLETTSESKGGSDNSGYAYESDARLMDEKQVLEICGILDIPRWAVNNYKSMPPPESAGAGRVRAFRGDEKRGFLARPEVSQEYVDEVSSATARLMDPSSSLSMNLNEGHPWETWPPISTCDNFEIPVNEIRKQAAWAWYRTGMLCELAARQSGLGDAAKGEGLASVKRSPMSMSLSLKSERAKSHALSLFPDLLHEERVECPSWAEPFTAGQIPASPASMLHA